MSKQYRYDAPTLEFKFAEKESRKKERVKKQVYEESREVKLEHVYAQLMNELYDSGVQEGDAFNLKNIEKTLIKLLLTKFTRTEAAKLLGVCHRALRNKINEYGYKDIRKDNSFLH